MKPDLVIRLRRRMKLTQTGLGRILGVTSRTIRNLESGRKIKVETIEKLRILAQRADGK